MSGILHRYLALGALGVLVIVTVVMALFNASFSVVIMANIAAIAFMTVVAVMVIGSEHGQGPVAASDSPAVAVWTARVARREELQQKPTTTTGSESTPAPVEAASVVTAQAAGASTGQAASDLSDAEKEAKRQAALERRKARAAKSTGESEN